MSAAALRVVEEGASQEKKLVMVSPKVEGESERTSPRTSSKAGTSSSPSSVSLTVDMTAGASARRGASAAAAASVAATAVSAWFSFVRAVWPPRSGRIAWMWMSMLPSVDLCWNE